MVFKKNSFIKLSMPFLKEKIKIIKNYELPVLIFFFILLFIVFPFG